MTVETFFIKNLDAIKELIAIELLNPTFDSHEFIRCFKKKFEVDYVKFLTNYKTQPFKNVHLQLGKCLSTQAEYLKIQKNGKVPSTNIFGNKTENEKWTKLN